MVAGAQCAVAAVFAMQTQCSRCSAVSSVSTPAKERASNHGHRLAACRSAQGVLQIAGFEQAGAVVVVADELVVAGAQCAVAVFDADAVFAVFGGLVGEYTGEGAGVQTGHRPAACQLAQGGPQIAGFDQGRAVAAGHTGATTSRGTRQEGS